MTCPPRDTDAGSHPDAVLVRTANVAATGAAAADRFALLDGHERDRLARMMTSAAARTYLTAHVLLRIAVAEHAGVAPDVVAFTRLPCHGCGGPHGRPALVGGGTEFSLTHSAGFVAVAVDHRRVGLDVEGLRDGHDRSSIVARLHPRERAYLEAQPAAVREVAFLDCWTRKEAYLKATGAGLTSALGAVYTGVEDDAEDTVPGWSIRSVPVPGSHRSAVAVRGGPVTVRVRPWQP